MSIAYKKNGSWVTASGTPPIDNALSATSENAVQNKIVKAAIENSASTLQQNFQAGVDDIYDAVVAKGSTPASKSLSDVVAGIGNIPTGIQPSGSISISQNGSVDVTNYATADVSVPTPTGNASEGDVLASKTFSNSSGTNKTGTMTNRGAVSQTLNTSTTSYTIPAGYHNGSGKVSITTQEKSCTPSSSSQTITPDSGKVLSKVTVGAMTETLTKFSQIRAAVENDDYSYNTSGSLKINFLKENLLYIIVSATSQNAISARSNITIVNNTLSGDLRILPDSYTNCKMIYVIKGKESGYLITNTAFRSATKYIFVIPMDY